MRGTAPFRLLSATALSLVLVNGLGVDLSAVTTGDSIASIVQGDQAEARSSGGRSRGGGFNRRSSGSGSSGGSSGGSSRPSSPSFDGGRSNPGPVIVPVPVGGGRSYSSGGSAFGALIFLVLFLIMPIAIFYLLRSRNQSGSSLSSGGGLASRSELDNDIVTVTQLQIALLAQARDVQTSLSQLTESADTQTPEGLTEMLHETVLALMRTPENWTHARATSKTVRNREEASQLFEQLSIEERSKLSVESLVKVGGRLRKQAIVPPEADEDPASYIVVTLLIGTEDDRPLVPNPIFSTADLQAALQRIGAVTSDYLLIYELIWSPQDPSDSLTREELLTEYPNLVQL